jgi:alpha-beta hydrolase superfamily lysophospholipase
MKQSFPTCSRTCSRLLKTKTKPRGIIPFVSGYGGHPLKHKHLVRACLDAGYHTMLISLPGHPGRGKLTESMLCPGLLVDRTLEVFQHHERQLKETNLPLFPIGFSTGFNVMTLVMAQLATVMPEVFGRIAGIYGLGAAIDVKHNVAAWMTKLLAPLEWLVGFSDDHPSLRSRTWGLKYVSVGHPDPTQLSHDPAVVRFITNDHGIYHGPLSAAWALVIHLSGKLAWQALPRLPFPVELFHGADDAIARPIRPDQVDRDEYRHVVVHQPFHGMRHDCFSGASAEAMVVRGLLLDRIEIQRAKWRGVDVCQSEGELVTSLRPQYV